MRPRLEWLDTFIAIAETGSLTRAAEQVSRSQSAVSLQLARLESVIGTRLFDRDTRTVRLNAAGERLLPRARAALHAADAALDAVGEPALRTVRVGVPEEYTDALVPALLDGTSHDRAVAFEVHCAPSAELERGLAARRLDVVFGLAEELEGEGEPVLADPVVWLQAPGRALLGRQPLPVALFDRECSWRARAIEALERAAIDYRVVFTSPSVAGVRAGVRAGFAVGALAASTAGDGLERLTGPGALPALPDARLVVLGARSEREDIATLVTRARRGAWR